MALKYYAIRVGYTRSMELLTTAETAVRLGVSVRRVLQFVTAQRLMPAKHVRGAFLFDAEAVAAFQAQPRDEGWKAGRPRKQPPPVPEE